VQEGLGDGRCAVPSRHGQKGGRRCSGWDRGNQDRVFLQRVDDSGRVGLRDTEPLGEGRERTGRGVPEDTECREQRREEDMNPLIGFALDHAE